MRKIPEWQVILAAAVYPAACIVALKWEALWGWVPALAPGALPVTSAYAAVAVAPLLAAAVADRRRPARLRLSVISGMAIAAVALTAWSVMHSLYPPAIEAAPVAAMICAATMSAVCLAAGARAAGASTGAATLAMVLLYSVPPLVFAPRVDGSITPEPFMQSFSPVWQLAERNAGAWGFYALGLIGLAVAAWRARRVHARIGSLKRYRAVRAPAVAAVSLLVAVIGAAVFAAPADAAATSVRLTFPAAPYVRINENNPVRVEFAGTPPAAVVLTVIAPNAQAPKEVRRVESARDARDAVEALWPALGPEYRIQSPAASFDLAVFIPEGAREVRVSFPASATDTAVDVLAAESVTVAIPSKPAPRIAADPFVGVFFGDLSAGALFARGLEQQGMKATAAAGSQLPTGPSTLCAFDVAVIDAKQEADLPEGGKHALLELLSSGGFVVALGDAPRWTDALKSYDGFTWTNKDALPPPKYVIEEATSGAGILVTMPAAVTADPDGAAAVASAIRHAVCRGFDAPPAGPPIYMASTGLQFSAANPPDFANAAARPRVEGVGRSLAALLGGIAVGLAVGLLSARRGRRPQPTGRRRFFNGPLLLGVALSAGVPLVVGTLFAGKATYDVQWAVLMLCSLFVALLLGVQYLTQMPRRVLVALFLALTLLGSSALWFTRPMPPQPIAPGKALELIPTTLAAQSDNGWEWPWTRSLLLGGDVQAHFAAFALVGPRSGDSDRPEISRTISTAERKKRIAARTTDHLSGLITRLSVMVVRDPAEVPSPVFCRAGAWFSPLNPTGDRWPIALVAATPEKGCAVYTNGFMPLLVAATLPSGATEQRGDYGRGYPAGLLGGAAALASANDMIPLVMERMSTVSSPRDTEFDALDPRPVTEYPRLVRERLTIQESLLASDWLDRYRYGRREWAVAFAGTPSNELPAVMPMMSVEPLDPTSNRSRTCRVLMFAPIPNWP